jgi:ribosomal protein S6
MNHYEAVYILDPKLDDQQLATMKTELKAKIEGVAAQDVVELKCDRRQLYAPIKKQRDAFYLIYGFSASGDTVGKLRLELKHTEHILRMSYIRVPTASVPEPQPVVVAPVAPVTPSPVEPEPAPEPEAPAPEPAPEPEAPTAEATPPA